MHLALHMESNLIGFFRKNPPSIAGHEAKLADLSKQITEAEADLARAEAAATDAALDGGNLATTVETVVRATAEIGALKTAKSQVEAELADLRAAAAEAEAARRKAEAQTQMLQLVSEMETTAEQIRPYLHKISGLVQTADRWLETFASQNVSPLLYGMDGALATLRSMAEQVRMSAESITAPVDDHGSHADTAGRVLAHPHNA
jgi:chromosome segregation ATPase